MSIRNGIVLAVALVLGSSSLAFAQGVWTRGTGQDSNAGNIIPLLNEPGVYGYNADGGLGMLLPAAPAAPVASAQVGLRTASVALGGGRGAAAAPIAQGGPYREDAVALGIARLYGRSGGAFGTAQVGLYQRPYVAARVAGRAIRSAPVGLNRGYQDYGAAGGY
jgi:hypothetical protein